MKRLVVGGAAVAAAAAMVALPTAGASQLTQSILMLAYLNAALTIAVTLSFGFTGMYNFSQATFAGAGAYATAILTSEHGVSFLAALAVSAVVAGGLGVLLGLASMRVRTDYFAFVSIGFTVVFVQLVANTPELTGGANGYFGIPAPSVFGLELGTPTRAYYLCLVCLAVVVMASQLVVRTYFGRAMRAVAEDEPSAQAQGISVGFTKAVAMGIGSALAGLCGSTLAVTFLFIQPADFDLLPSFNFTLWAIVGGSTSIVGAGTAALGITFLQEHFRDLYEYRLAIVSSIVLLAIYVRGGVISPRRIMHRIRSEKRR